MKDYEFRGKLINSKSKEENGKWVYGDLQQDKDLGKAYISGFDYPIGDSGPERKDFLYEVDTETVGQFIGRFDKHGRKIYEGDSIKGKTLPYNRPHEGVVVYSELIGGFVSKAQYGCELFINLNLGEIEITGNIHDNPEYLKLIERAKPDKEKER